jgi:hypothetical protein
MYLIIILITFGVVGHNLIEKWIHRSMTITEAYRVKLSNGRKLQGLLRSFFSGPDSSKILPQYKFFTLFTMELRQLQLSHGVSSRELLKALRSWLTLDLQFEQKIQNQLKNSLAQFLILSIFTWVFYLNAVSALECELSWEGFCTLQILGFICFIFTFQFKKIRHFEGIDEVSKRLLLFQSLKKVGLSIGEVLGRSKADQSFEITDKNTRELGQQLVAYSQSWVKTGRSIEGELNELSEELIYLKEQKRVHFEKQLAVMRFIHLVVFYLIGYLLVVMGLIRQLALSY